MATEVQCLAGLIWTQSGWVGSRQLRHAFASVIWSTNNFGIISWGWEANTEVEIMKVADTFLLGKILVFGVTLPTVDTFSDLFLAGKLFQSGHTLWAIAILLPVLFNFLFVVIAFRQFPFTPWHHQYISLAMLLLQVAILVSFLTVQNILFPGLAPVFLPWDCSWVSPGGTWLVKEEGLLFEEHLHLWTFHREHLTAGHQALHMDLLPPGTPGKVPRGWEPTVQGGLGETFLLLLNMRFRRNKRPWHHQILQGWSGQVPPSPWSPQRSLYLQVHLQLPRNSVQRHSQGPSSHHLALLLPGHASSCLRPAVWTWPRWDREPA